MANSLYCSTIYCGFAEEGTLINATQRYRVYQEVESTSPYESVDRVLAFRRKIADIEDVILQIMYSGRHFDCFQGRGTAVKGIVIARCVCL